MHDLYVTVSAYIYDMFVNQMHMVRYRLVHDEYIRTIACYGIGAIIFLKANCDSEHGISFYST